MTSNGFGGFSHTPTPTQTLWASRYPPKNPLNEQIWLDLFANQLKRFDGSTWVTIGGGGGSMTGAEILAELLTVDGIGSGLDAELLAGQPASHYEGGGTAEEILAKLLTVDGTGSGLDANFVQEADLASLRNANLLTGTVARHNLGVLYRDKETDRHESPYFQTGYSLASPGGTLVTFDYTYSFVPRVVCDGSYRAQSVTTSGFVARHSTSDFIHWISLGTFL